MNKKITKSKNKNENPIEKYVILPPEELGLNEEDMEKLAILGLELIQNDKKELANYAINHILMDFTDKVTEQKLLKTKFKKIRENLRLLVKEGV